MTEGLVMDNVNNDTRLVRAGLSPTHQSHKELDRAKLVAMDHVNDDACTVRVGSSPRGHDQSDEGLDDTGASLRLELLTTIFAAEPVQIKDITTPPECKLFPDQRLEIISRYLFHTDFSVKVWISFDASQEVFFEGTRSAACGKLRLPKEVYHDLTAADPGLVKFQQVRFEVGTPFRTLAVLDLTVEHDDDRFRLRVRGNMMPEHSNKYRLFKYIKHCCQRIGQTGLADGVDGITFTDLEFYASMFRRDREASPGRNEDWEEPAYEGGEWAGVKDPHQVRRFTKWRWP